MSDFKNSNVRIPTGKGIYFGDNQEAFIGFEGGNLSITQASGSLQDQINALDLTYATDLVLASVSGALQDQINSLDFTYATDASLTSVSGALFNQIPTDFYSTSEVDVISGAINVAKASAVHTHDDLYYTEGEVDVISGAINVAKADAIHTHDDRYYTESEMDVTASGTTKYFGSSDWRITVSGVDIGFDKWDGADWIRKTTVSGA